ncbi:MAG TPA: Ig-like domain repeat protein [Acidobacteriaceae bacterium]|jgi:hypothetical protein|nr:Ig-like domain repeat protein [Acidobacteriaceae bacterium]
MLTTPTTSLRRMLASTLTVFVACAAFVQGASAQSSAPAVIGSFAATQTPPSSFGSVIQTNIDNYGNWIIPDSGNNGLYEVPAGGGPIITLAPSGTSGDGATSASDGPIIGATFDSYNNMYLSGAWSNCALMFPWDAAKQTWDGLSTLSLTNSAASLCGTAPYGFAKYSVYVDNYGSGSTAGSINYFQPYPLAMLPGNVLVVSNQTGPMPIFTVQIDYPGNDPTSSNCTSLGNCSPTAAPGTSTVIIEQMTAKAYTLAGDKFGNIYFTEASGGLVGAYMVPAGVANLTSDTDPSIVRVDPNLTGVTGVATDANGNVYISNNDTTGNTSGVYVVPANSATGTPNISAAYLLTPIPAVASVSVDLTRGLLYVPTTNNGLATVSFAAAELGATATGAPAATSQPVYLAFNQAETPGPFTLQEAGTATPDFMVGTGGTCVAGTAQAAMTGCTVNVTLDPQNAGNVSASLLTQDSSGNLLDLFDLHGTGTGAAVNVFPGGETPSDAGLKTPAQVAVDAAGNTYVADSGLNEVLMFAKGSATGTVIGTGLTQPTGVAVDGAGDVFIADSGSGTVVEIPVGTAGLNAAGQITLKSGLGMTGLNLATDGAGHLYIADPQNKQVVKLTNPGAGVAAAAQTETDLNTASGYNFLAPAAVATDSSEDLYVADGSNLVEVTPSGTQSTPLTSLSAATGLVVDPSGSVYIAEPGGVVRVPSVGGTLTASAQQTIALDVTNPTSVALDPQEDLYIADATNGDVDMVSASASTDFGTQATPTSVMPPVTYTVLNSGNSGLTVSGFSSTPDYSVTSEDCSGGSTPLDPNASCSATVTFNPGPGDSGTLLGFVQVQGNEANQPVGVEATGVGAALAGSTTTMAVSSPTVDNAPVLVTVTPTTAGTTPAPTGSVTLTISGGGLASPMVVNGTLSAGTGGTGTATLTPPQLPAGSYMFAVSYQGDRVYSGSDTSAAVTLAPSPILLGQPTLEQSETQDGTYIAEPGATLNSDGSCCATYGSAYVNGVLYVLSSGQGALESYDGTPANIYYKYPMTVTTTSGAPLLGNPVYQGSVQTATNYGTVTFTITGPTSFDTTAAQTGCAAVAVNADGTANFQTTCLPIDTSNNSIPDIETSYTVSPSYSPAYLSPGSDNPNYSAVAGTSFTVAALAHPMVVITADPSSLSVAKGSSASTTLTLTSLLGYGYTGANGNQVNYALPVDLQCDGLPAYATCSFSYPAAPAASQWDPNPDPDAVYVTPIGTPTPDGESVGPGQVVMTITTNIPTGEGASLMHRSGGTEWAAMFGLGLLGLAFGKRRSLRGRLMVMLLVLLTSGIVAGSTGCSTTQLGGSQQVTPAGTFQVLVTARQTGSAYIVADTSSPWVYGSGDQVSLPFTVNVTVQ